MTKHTDTTLEAATPDATPTPHGANPSLLDPLVWLLRDGLSVKFAELCAALAPYVTPQLPDTAGAERPVDSAVREALEQLVSAGVCEFDQGSQEWTACLTSRGSFKFTCKAEDMECTAYHGFQDGLALLEDGKPHSKEEVADCVATSVTNRWGMVTRRLLVAYALEQIATECQENENLKMYGELKIDAEFAAWLRLHTEEETAQLEDNLLETRCCRDPLVVWDDGGVLTLLDGHLRYQLCRKHGITFTITTVDLKDRQAAKDWIVCNQRGRRNLTPEQDSYYRGQVYNARKVSHGGARTPLQASVHADHLKTCEEIAKQEGVSPMTVRRAGAYAEAVDRIVETNGPHVKNAILSGETNLTQVDVIDLGGKEPQERQQAVAEAIHKKTKPKEAKGKEEKVKREKANDTIKVPVEPSALARVVFEQLGREKAREVHTSLGKLLGVRVMSKGRQSE